ncbi:MAG TPA: CRISPR-associated endonuclease Cas1 [Saprospiraceae bacterium]|nr:CRISPR-associated endonuclease Cas1 [Saprospiraceae bacterium]HMP26217.1 CRISPR-associated endonuclease Cas1 [Saprospiraceae bacterium]
MQLVLDTNGLTLQKRNNSFWIVHSKGRRLISPHRITSIAVVRDCLISAAAIRLAAKHGIPIFFFSASGKAEAQLRSAGFGSIATIRRQQIRIAETARATQLVIHWFQLKADHQLQHLRLLANRRAKAHDWQAAMAFVTQQRALLNGFQGTLLTDSRPSMLGIEGSIARRYWAAISAAVPQQWQFDGRSRQPAQDAFNAALNYLYGMLYNLMENAAFAAGLDPYLGFFHVDAYNRPTFVYDLIEPFRPWVDTLLWQLTMKNPAPALWVTPKEDGMWLSKEGRKMIIPAFNAFMEENVQFQHKRLSRKNQIHYFTGRLAQQLLKDDFDLLG